MADENGIQFPRGADGRRSSTHTTKAVFAAALEPASPAKAQALRADPQWRKRYPGYLRELTARSIGNADVALASAERGLDAAGKAFEFCRDGASRPLGDAMAAPRAEALRAVAVDGRERALVPRLEVPYRGQLLAGDALLRQLDAWERANVVEPSNAQALRELQRHPEWLDLSERTFALLGAGAELSPLRWLMRWRARVAAVDRRADVWTRLLELAGAGNGRLIVPVVSSCASDYPRAWTAHAGADLLTDTPEIAAWLTSLGGPVDLGCFAYLDGERHTRVVMAMDAIATAITSARPGTTLGFFATPTDIFAVSEEVLRAAADALKARAPVTKIAESLIRAASGGRFFQPIDGRVIESNTGGRYALADSVVLEQGPSYALAKRLQQWRAVVARHAGQVASINVAPMTATRSVVSNRMLAAGYRGADAFGIEVFGPETTGALMAALWVHDLRNPQSAAQPSTALRHPLELLSLGANHSGVWRSPYVPRTMLPFAALLGFMRPTRELPR